MGVYLRLGRPCKGNAHLALMDGKAEATALRSLGEAVHGTAQMV
jgi:hypothetical protein